MREEVNCRGCLHKEIGTFEEVSASIDNYISMMDEDICVTSEIYESRLDSCFSCDSLYGRATCRYCGCFVRIRARLKDQTCPCPGGSRWNK